MECDGDTENAAWEIIVEKGYLVSQYYERAIISKKKQVSQPLNNMENKLMSELGVIGW